ncbi:MAG: hypothetical protein FJ291_16280 [Planctomycetes bacterium]|nr:hypothetical protein [Planctomycetota bacterium]
MTPSNVLQLELAAAFASRRALALRVGVALLLGLPFAVAEMPLRARVAGLTVLTVFVSFFGAAVGAVRRRADGQTMRLALLPIPRAVVASDLLLAGSVVDLVQVGPVVALFGAVNGRGPAVGAVLGVAAALAFAVLLLNALGMLLAGAARSNAEVHLAAALGVAAIVLLSGLVPAAGPLLGAVRAAARFSPVAWLAGALGSLATDPPGGTAWPLPASAAALLSLAGWLAARGGNWKRGVT